MNMKKILSSFMAIAMLANMNMGVFANNFEMVEPDINDDIIVLEPGPESRIRINQRTKSFKKGVWSEVARANNLISEDIRVKIDNISGGTVDVRLLKNGTEYRRETLSLGEFFTFDVAWNEGEYTIQFKPSQNATITYSIHTIS